MCSFQPSKDLKESRLYLESPKTIIGEVSCFISSRYSWNLSNTLSSESVLDPNLFHSWWHLAVPYSELLFCLLKDPDAVLHKVDARLHRAAVSVPNLLHLTEISNRLQVEFTGKHWLLQSRRWRRL